VLFTLLMILISLNMVLAIIFDVYAEVKSNADKEPSLLQQIANFWQAGKAKSDAKAKGGFDDTVSHVATDGSNTTRGNIGSPYSEAPESVAARIGSVIGEVKDGFGNFKDGIVHSVEIVQEEVEHAHHEVQEAQLEEKVLDALKLRDLHPEEVITANSLIEALGLKNNRSTREGLEEIIVEASENSEAETSMTEFGMINNIRLLLRIDHNLREVLHKEAENQLLAAKKHTHSLLGKDDTSKKVEKMKSSGSLAQRKAAAEKIQKIWQKREGSKASWQEDPGGKFVSLSQNLLTKVDGLHRECSMIAEAAGPQPPSRPPPPQRLSQFEKLYPEPSPPNYAMHPDAPPPDEPGPPNYAMHPDAPPPDVEPSYEELIASLNILPVKEEEEV